MGSRSLTPSNSLLACAARPGLTLGAAALLPPAEVATLSLSPSKPKVAAKAEVGENDRASDTKLIKHEDDDDFDIESYYARLHAIPSTIGLQSMEPVNPVEDSNFSEIDLNSSAVGQGYAGDGTESQGITSDLAQNLSQLPQVLPQVANTVLSSFTSILNLGRSTIAGTVEISYGNSQMNVHDEAADSSNAYQNNQSYDESLPAVPLFNREEFSEGKPVSGQNINNAANPTQTIPQFPSQVSNDNENAPKNVFRLNSKKKKTYAHVPGLTLGEMGTPPVVANIPEHRIMEPVFHADYENQNRPADFPSRIEIPTVPQCPQPFRQIIQNTNVPFELPRIPLQCESFDNSIHHMNDSAVNSDQNNQMHYKQSLVKDNTSVMQSSNMSNNATPFSNINILKPVPTPENIDLLLTNPSFNSGNDNLSTQNIIQFSQDLNTPTQPPIISNNTSTQISSCNLIENQHLVHHPYVAMDNQQLFNKNSNQFVTSCFEAPIVSARETVSHNIPVDNFPPNLVDKESMSVSLNTINNSVQGPEISPLSDSFKPMTNLNVGIPSNPNEDNINLQNISPLLPHMIQNESPTSNMSLENNLKLILMKETAYLDSNAPQAARPPIFFNPNSLSSNVSNMVINNPSKPIDKSKSVSGLPKKPPTISGSNANNFRMKSSKLRPKYYSGPIDFSTATQNNVIDNNEKLTAPFLNNQSTDAPNSSNTISNQNNSPSGPFKTSSPPEKTNSGFGFSVFQNLSKIQNTVTSLFVPAENQNSQNAASNFDNPTTINSNHSFSLDTQNNATENQSLNQQNFYTNHTQQQNYFYNPNQFVSEANNEAHPNAPPLQQIPLTVHNSNDFVQPECNQYNYFYNQPANKQAENSVPSNETSLYAENNSNIVFQNDNNEILQASQFFHQLTDEGVKNLHEPITSRLSDKLVTPVTDTNSNCNEPAKYDNFYNQPQYQNQEKDLYPSETCLPPPLHKHNLTTDTPHKESNEHSDSNQSAQYNLFYSELMNPDKGEEQNRTVLSNQNNSGNFDSNQTSQLYKTNTNENKMNNVNDSHLLTSYGSNIPSESNNFENNSIPQSEPRPAQQTSLTTYTIELVNTHILRDSILNNNSLTFANAEASNDPVNNNDDIRLEDYLIEPCDDDADDVEEVVEPSYDFPFINNTIDSSYENRGIFKDYPILFENDKNNSNSFFDAKKPTVDNPYLVKQNKHQSLNKDSDSNTKTHYELFSAFANDNAIKEFHLFEPNKNSNNVPFGDTPRNYIRLNSQSSDILNDKSQHSLLESKIQKDSVESFDSKMAFYHPSATASFDSASRNNDHAFPLAALDNIDQDLSICNDFMDSAEGTDTEPPDNTDSVEQGNDYVSEDESLKADNEVKEILSNANDSFLNESIANVKPFSSGTKIQNSLMKEEVLRKLKNEVDEILSGGPVSQYHSIPKDSQKITEDNSVSTLLEKLNLESDNSQMNKFDDDDYLNSGPSDLRLSQPNVPIDYSNLLNEPFESVLDKKHNFSDTHPTVEIENIEHPFESSKIVQYDDLHNSELSIKNSSPQQKSFDGSNSQQSYVVTTDNENSLLISSNNSKQSDPFSDSANFSTPNLDNSNVFLKLENYSNNHQEPRNIERHQDSSLDLNIPQPNILNDPFKAPENQTDNNSFFNRYELQSFPASSNAELSKSFFTNNELTLNESISSINISDQNKSETSAAGISNIGDCNKQSENNLSSSNSKVAENKDVPLFNYFSMMPESGQSDFKF